MAKKVGILVPMPLELKPLLDQTYVEETVMRAGLKMRSGMLFSRRIVLAVCGIGKVNSAMAAQAMIDHCRLDALILSGVAGAIAPDVVPGDVVVANRLHQYDVGALREHHYSPLPLAVRDPKGGQLRVRVLNCSERLVMLAVERGSRVELPFLAGNAKEGTSRGSLKETSLLHAKEATSREGRPRVTEGAIITGDALVLWPEGLRWLGRTFDAVAIDMEGAAVAQVAQANGVEFVAIRGISDTAADLAELELERVLGMGGSSRLEDRVGALGRMARFALARPRNASGVLRLARAMNGAARNAAAVVTALVAALE